MSAPPRTTAPDPARSKPPSSRWIVLGRILLLLLAAGAVVASFVLSRRDDHAAGQPGGRYACPMHPEVTSAGPGECPICRMELEPVGGREAQPAAGAATATGPSGGSPNSQYYDIMRRRVFQQDVRAPAWVEDDGAISAVLYKDELATLAPEERGVFAPSAAPGAGVAIHLTTEPPAPWDRSTSRVRFRVDGPEPPVQRGEIGWVRLSTRRREVQVIPYSAVLQSAEGPYVLIASQDGRRLTKRPLEIGRVFGGLAVVLSGLHNRERVLIRSAFFYDAERRLRREASLEVTP